MIKCLCDDCRHSDGGGFCNDDGYFYPTISFGNMGIPTCEDYDAVYPDEEEE